MFSTIAFVLAFVFLLIYPKYIFTAKLASNYVRLHSKHAKITWIEHVRSALPYENNYFLAELMDIRILGKTSRFMGIVFICAAVNTVIMRSVLVSGNELYIFITTTLNALIIALSFALDVIIALLCCKYLDKKNLILFAIMPPLCFFAMSNSLNKFFIDNKDTLIGTYAEE